MKKEGLAQPPKSRTWTRIEDYLRPLDRRSAVRRRLNARLEPESPRLLLSTLPFLLLLGVLMLLTAAIAIVAWPASQPEVAAAPSSVAVPDLGTAPKGWFQEAQKQFHPQS